MMPARHLQRNAAPCRYEEMAVKDANSKKDWGRAEQYYYQAVDVFPEGDASTMFT